MKRLVFTLTILFVIWIDVHSQNQNPCWVSFGGSQDQGYTVNFTGYSSPDSSGYYFWTFGDGSAGSGQNISHTYLRPGEYNVCVYYDKRSSQLGDTCRANYCAFIYVQECNMSASFTTTQTNGLVNFFGTSSNGAYGIYTWNFGDGSSAVGQNVNHQYPFSGTYVACLLYQRINPNFPFDTCRKYYCDTIQVEVSGCNVSADFTYAPRSSEMQFMVASPAPNVIYRWNLGDGTVSYGQSINHEYATPGNYTVCLTAQRINPNYPQDTCTATSCDTITVTKQGCNLSTSFTTTAIGSGINFFGTSSSAGGYYRWDFGDGTNGYGQNVNHQYLASGTYVACLTYIRHNQTYPYDSCSAFFCDTINVAIERCSVNARFTSYQIGNSVNFYGDATSGGGTYYWDFGDGTNAVGQFANHQYGASGNYIVCLKYEFINPYNPSDTCRSSYCDSIAVEIQKCNLNSSFTTIRSGTYINFYGSATTNGGNYFWDFGDGAWATGQEVTHQYQASGVYHACVTYERINPNFPHDTCVATYCDSVRVQLPACSTNTSFTSTQRGNAVSFAAIGTSASQAFFRWNFGDGSTGFGQQVDHVFPGPGTYTVCVTYTTISPNFPHDTCEAVFCDSIIIQKADCNINASFTSSGVGKNVSFYGNASPAYGTYVWNFGDGTFAAGQNVAHYYPSAGSYVVCLTYRAPNSNYSDSCIAVYCDTITIQKPECNVSSFFTSTRVGNTVSFYGNGSPAYGSYTWNFGDGTSTTTAVQNVTHYYTSQGSYVVCLTYRAPNTNYSDSCLAVFCDTITIQKPACNVNASFTSTQSGRTVNFFGTGTPGSAVNYFWIFGDGTTGVGKNVSHTYAMSGTYSVCLTYSIVNPNSQVDTCVTQFCKSVTIQKPSCNVGASFTTAPGNGNTVAFYGKSSPGTLGYYYWNFGDGSTGRGKNTFHTYSSPGNYVVCLTFIKSQPNFPNDSCMAIFCDTIRVGRPACNLTASFQDSVAGRTVYLTAQTSSSVKGLYKWSFGDGSTLSTSNPTVKHAYANPGTYIVTMDFYLINIHGTCIASDMDTITIRSNRSNRSTINVYPMPASDKLNYELIGEDEGDEETSVEIISSFGDVIKRQKHGNGNAIDIQDIPAGFYILRVIKNNKVYTQQFLKN